MIDRHQNMIRHLYTIFFLFSVLFSAPAYSDFIECQITKDKDNNPLKVFIPITIKHNSFKMASDQYIDTTIDSQTYRFDQMYTGSSNEIQLRANRGHIELYLIKEGYNNWSLRYKIGNKAVGTGRCAIPVEVCDELTISTCNNDVVCKRATAFTAGKNAWHSIHNLNYNYVTEAKKRNLACGVGSTISNYNDFICGNATTVKSGTVVWFKSDHSGYKEVIEAKKLGLSCGVGSASLTPTDPTDVCPINLTACADKYMCKIAAPISLNGKRVWLPNYLVAYKFVIEAKNRGLSCGTTSTSAEPKAGSNLPNCPSDTNARWHNCFGTYTFGPESEWAGDKYVGEWKDNNRTGQGTYIFGAKGEWAGDTYVGEFKDDKRTGQGTYTWANGNKYVGEYKDDKRTGQGTYTWANGNKYVGEYKDNNRTGQGTFTHANGDNYVGEWKDNDYNGQGTYTHADGKVEEGTWKDDKLNGQATITYADGTVEEGIWKDDEFQNTTASKPSKDPQVVPSVQKKKPKTPIKPALLLDNPLHIKAYGKSYHLPLLPSVLFFIGEIEDGDEQGFRRALRDNEIATIVLVSPGGLISNGLELANIIYDNNLATYIPSGETCASACSFMYFAGNPKVAHGRLGVHQFYLDDDKKKVSIGTVQRGTQLLVADIIQNLTDFDTPSSVFSKMFSTRDMYYFSEEEKRSFSNTEMSDETIAKINQLLLYFTKYLNDELDQDALKGMPQGMKNRLIQLELKRIGCMQGPVDGIKGGTTTSAIQLLSSKRGSNLSALKFSDLFRRLNNTEVGACY